MKTVIETFNLFKIFPSPDKPIKAVNDISIAFDSGEFTAIVGPSGSGKTTFLNQIGGLDTPTEGRIVVDGNEITKLSESKLFDFRLRNIGFVFQSYNLIPVLTAEENVSFIMLLQGRPKKEIRERARHILKEVGLEDKMSSRPSELSGGQQQRVAVARALASKPKFILADEPTANLDSVSAGNLLDMMRKLNEESGITFLFSTHDQRVIDRAARVVTLVDGKVNNDEKR